MSAWIVVAVIGVLALVFLWTLRAKSLDTVNFKFEMSKLLGFNFEIRYRSDQPQQPPPAPEELEPQNLHEE